MTSKPENFIGNLDGNCNDIRSSANLVSLRANDRVVREDSHPQRPWVGVDGRSLMLEEGTGVSRYGKAVASAIHELGYPCEVLLDRAADPNGRLPAYGRPAHRLHRWIKAIPTHGRRAGISPTMPETVEFSRFRHAEDVYRLAQVHFDIYGRLLRIRHPSPPAIMHWTYPLPIAFEGSLNVYTVHDIIPLSHPALTPIAPARHRAMLSRVLASADHVVTVSETSRRAIIDTFNFPDHKITNTYEAVTFPEKQKDEALILRQYGLKPQGYFIALGTIERRKNIGRLIQAYLASGVRAPLVLVGPMGWEAAAELAPAQGHFIDAQAAAHGASGILPLGFVSQPAVQALLQNAQSLLFPSRAEGFGLPVIEAMALGTPVVTSIGGATGEVAGGASLSVDPLNVSEIAAAIGVLEAQPELRAMLTRRGLRRAADFSIDRHAERLGMVYRRVLSPVAEMAPDAVSAFPREYRRRFAASV